VEEAGVEIADAPLIGAVGRPGRGGLLDEVADLLFGPVEQQPEGAVGGAVGGDRVVAQPTTVDVAEQVVLRADPGVGVAQVDAGAGGCIGHRAILSRRTVASRPCPNRSRRPTPRRPTPTRAPRMRTPRMRAPRMRRCSPATAWP